MRDLIYPGPANVRILEQRDFAKMGIKHKHTIEFERGIRQQVSDSVADALLSHHLVLGEFIELPDEEETPLVEDDETEGDGESGETVDDQATAASENADGHPQQSASEAGSRSRSGKQRPAS